MDLLDTTLLDALKRKPKQLAFQTVYSHLNLLEWLKESLPEWNIMVPQNQSPALSEWPSTAESRWEIINCTKKIILDGASRIRTLCWTFSYPGRVVISSRIRNYPGRSVQDNILDASRITFLCWTGPA